MKYIVLCYITMFPGITFGEDPLKEYLYDGCKTAAMSKAQEMAPKFGPEVTVSCGCMLTEKAIERGIIKRGELKRPAPRSI